MCDRWEVNASTVEPPRLVVREKMRCSTHDCTSIDYAESRFSGLKSSRHVGFSLLGWSKIAPENHNSSAGRSSQHRVGARAGRHDWACRADVVNRAGLVLQLKPSRSHTHTHRGRAGLCVFILNKHFWKL